MIDSWKLIDTYYKSNKNYLTRHHLESFDDFVLNKIPLIIKTLNPIIVQKNDITVEIILDSENIKVTPPKNSDNEILYPNECRLYNLNYFSNIVTDITVNYIQNEKVIVSNQYTGILIGAIPIMLHSKLCYLNGLNNERLSEAGECPYDQGGYFIVDGKEKVIISQERIATNKLFINKSSNPELFRLEAMIRSSSYANSLFPKAVYFWVCNDVMNNKGIIDSKIDDEDDEKNNEQIENIQKDNKKISDEFSIKLNIMNINLNKIPLFLIFRALGIESDRDILNHISFDDPLLHKYLVKSIVDATLVKYSDHPIYTQEQALNYLSAFVKFPKTDYVRYILMNDLFPNIGHDFHEKALYLGHLVKELILTAIGKYPENKRDNYMFKRVDTTGIELGNIFRDFYNKFRNDIINTVEQEYNTSNSKNTTQLIHNGNLNSIFKSFIISEGMYKSMKGNWGLTGDPSEQGIVQDVSRLSYIGYVSHMRRVNTPIDRSIKLVEPHRLDAAQWGMMCPIESPDGGNIGLLKHMAASCEITSESNADDIFTCLTKLDMIALKDVTPNMTKNKCKVMLNNNWVGLHQNPRELYKTLLSYRRKGILNAFISISWKIIENMIVLFSDAGRCVRPLIVHEHMSKIQSFNPKSSWSQLVNGYTFDYTFDMNKSKPETGIEYIDCYETNSLYIAMLEKELNDKHTHMEIHPCLSLSMYSNTIPFANHNQAPRNVFSGQQGKQALGIYATNYNHRIDTASYLLHYPQRNLITTKMAKYAFKNNMPNGENLIVAIATYTGYNQEDSIIVNRSSIQRGMFNVSYFKSIVETETLNEYTHEKVIFKNPTEIKKQNPHFKHKLANWSKIDEFGIPIVNEFIEDGDIYLGKVHVTTKEIDPHDDDIFAENTKQLQYKDSSLIGDKTVNGTIDKVLTYTKDNTQYMKARLRKFRIPELGDKMASSHGQKGVCGMILDQQDMPYTKDGIVPDIIVNPHAFPSRMTIGHLIESVLSKLCCYSGEYIDGTVFENHDIKSYFNTLGEHFGHHRYGDEIMYNGFTGEQINTEIFFGPTFYYRLKHMVKDKINYRDKGPRELMTKQPTQGRANGGGLRIGEMETNAILGHGISSFIKESMMERSDKDSLRIHRTTGDDYQYHEDANITDEPSTTLQIPYSMKLLRQEVQSMGVNMKFIT
jgi:DNA-directed RNA polymerase II subunit RPB2